MENLLGTRSENDKKTESRDFTSKEITELRQTNTVDNLLHPLEREKIKNAEQDRGLKGKLAHCFLWILIGQLVIMNIIFACTGIGWLSYDQWTLDLYMTGTLAQVFGVVLVMTKNLFPIDKALS